MQVRRAVLKQLGVVPKLTLCNPGMIEAIRFAALTDHPRVRYIRQPQEQVVTGTGDGHAHPSGHSTVLQMHSLVGLGNEIAMLSRALGADTPRFVIPWDTRPIHRSRRPPRYRSHSSRGNRQQVSPTTGDSKTGLAGPTSASRQDLGNQPVAKPDPSRLGQSILRRVVDEPFHAGYDADGYRRVRQR